MKKTVSILIALAKGELLMQRGAGGEIAAFGAAMEAGEVPVKAAVRVLREETGLDVRSDDLEFLDSYKTAAVGAEAGEVQVFVLAGVDEDRVHAYGGEESLCKIQRNDDFSEKKLSDLARKYVIDYFKRHKKW